MMSGLAKHVPSPSEPINDISGSKEALGIDLVYDDEEAIPLLLQVIQEEIKSRGLLPRLTPFNKAQDCVREGARVIAFLSGKSLLVVPDDIRFRAFQHIAQNAASLVCLTSCGIVEGRDPDGAITAGLLRTIGSENPITRYLSIDIDADRFNTNEPGLVQCILDQESAIQQGYIDETETDTEDREFVWQNECLYVSRVVQDPGFQGYSEVIQAPKTCGTSRTRLGSDPVRADFETPGVLSSLYFKPYKALWRPLPPDWIDIKVVAVGLNWKDVGLTSGRFDGSNLSSEYTGIIIAIGSIVTDLAVGDNVYGTGKGHFGNFTRQKAETTHRLQTGDNLVEMATMPLVYMTAVYAFENLAHLQRGQTVLIQSATGGLGLAAIQFARAKGAEVFATVGTADKAKFLVDMMKVPKSHIFSSREQSDLPRAAKMTKKGGFDVILSSSKGDMLYASIKALAPLGHITDVGRIDVTDARATGLELFQMGATFSSFDLSILLDSDPSLGGKLLQTVDKHYRNGSIGPIRPFRAIDVSKLDQALLEFSKGTHIGKFVVTYLDLNTMVRFMPGPRAVRFQAEACYIVTGGFGGLGQSMIGWMGAHGARYLVALSRRGIDSPGARAFIGSMKRRGIEVQAVTCDVGKREQVNRVIADVAASRPLRGIIHSAVSYLDISFEKVSIERWRESLVAKVDGTKNLHEATTAIPLDFFVMSTSIESICALATQSAYTAANNFQDYFARYRRRLGLPATAISFGFINDVGPLSTNSITVDLFARNKVLTIPEHQFLALLELALLNDQAQGTPGATSWLGQKEDPLSAANMITCMDPAALAAKKLDEEEEAGIQSTMYDQAIKAGPEGVANTADLVKRGITSTVAEMLFIDPLGVNASKSIAGHGVDSLIAAEMRNWFHQAFGANISMLELLDARTSISELWESIASAAVKTGADVTAAQN
ncbi:hypothetical protein GQX73_g3893 [Xylaria multiplex]|uniref:Carrier domain-containing protein n=1 Tax=Xylaria multiplex TaxID=323545 RepID=A0A7C8N6L4_9PEZI|nr:hypothetical protein GQX73_g3893 [Xylaria multiplex]